MKGDFMAKVTRNIVKIDEDKCNGCGLCIPSCKEGALQIVDGKARLVKEIYCDGLGACLGDCPEGAIIIEKREADAFDEAAVEEHLKERNTLHASRDTNLPCGCPGTMTKTIERKDTPCNTKAENQQSELRQWPIQLALIPSNASYLKNADFVLLADCTAVAYANLHTDVLRNRIIAMACPKLDNVEPYIEKLAQMIKINNFRSIEVVMMEVPCCNGLGQILDKAIEKSGINVNVIKTIITIEGEKI